MDLHLIEQLADRGGLLFFLLVVFVYGGWKGWIQFKPAVDKKEKAQQVLINELTGRVREQGGIIDRLMDINAHAINVAEIIRAMKNGQRSKEDR